MNPEIDISNVTLPFDIGPQGAAGSDFRIGAVVPVGNRRGGPV